MSRLPKIIVILGPTASGKSDLSVEIAKKWNGEVISADSRQVYTGMNIGTGKITKKEMKGVPHHMLNVLSPKRTFNAGLFQKRARRELDKILKRKKVPIICGGTGFYIDTLIYDYNLPSVPRDTALRNKLEKETTDKLYERLKKLDPARARNIDPYNKVRLIRSLEIIMKTKRPLPRLKRNEVYDVLKIGILNTNDELQEKIFRRTEKQVRSGMVSEVKRLKQKGMSNSKFDSLGLEYKWVNRYLEGDITKAQMLETLKKEVWQYAKRQLTWFRKDAEINWIRNENEAMELVKRFLQ